MELQFAVVSQCGDRQTNEDACGYWHNGGPVCCALADGAGGHGGGDVASKLSVQTALQRFSASPNLDVDAIGQLVVQANHAVLQAQRDGGLVADMRSTLVLLAIDPANKQASWVHIGDSRLYWLRDGRIIHRTRDHSLVQSLIDAGFITEDQRAGHPGRDALTAALGSEDDCTPDLSTPRVALQQGDAFLMCSDGLWSSMADSDITASLERARTVEDWVQQLADHVVERDKPGQDNYSAIAVWCGMPPGA